MFVKSKPTVRLIEIPASAVCVTKLDKGAVVKVIETLKLEAIPHSVLENFSVFCDIESNALYFPLKDVDGTIVGYKRLSNVGNDVVEVTKPDTDSFGLIKSHRAKLNKDFNSAILVLSIVDMLALATQKINCKLTSLAPFFLY